MTFIQRPISAALLSAAVFTGASVAQTTSPLRLIHRFNSTDGAYPRANLAVSGRTLYGTTSAGGPGDGGTVFKVNVDGTGFINLHSFSDPASGSDMGTNTDGAKPFAPVVIEGQTLYGTTTVGGPFGRGTLFAVTTNGSSFRILHDFSDAEGVGPSSGLVLAGDYLFGTSSTSNDVGTVFTIRTDGSGFSNIYHFIAASPWPFTNRDGAFPNALVVVSNRLFGTTQYGGIWGEGTVFGLNTDGTQFGVLHTFSARTFQNPGPPINLDGAEPQSRLVNWDGTLYGTTTAGAGYGQGAVFRLKTDGSDFLNLYSFGALAGLLAPPYTQVNGDGAFMSELVLAGNTLYAAGSQGGFWGFGTIVEYRPYGLTVLHDFTIDPRLLASTNIDGANPTGVIASGDSLYGATTSGGAGFGTVFSLFLASSYGLPRLTSSQSGSNILLTWPGEAMGFTLQSSTNLASRASWTDVSIPPMLANGQNVVTNPVSTAGHFFRLIQ